MSAVLGAAPGTRSYETGVPTFLRGRRLTRPLFYLALTALALYSLAPLAIVVFTSLKSEIGLAQNPIGPPVHPQWGNFVQAWNQGSIGVGMENSAILTLGTIAGVCVIAGSAAYAMARLDLPGSNSVIAYLIFTAALPLQLFLVPLFFLWTRLHLYNTLIGVIIIYWAIFSPFATLLLTVVHAFHTTGLRGGRPGRWSQRDSRPLESHVAAVRSRVPHRRPDLGPGGLEQLHNRHNLSAIARRPARLGRALRLPARLLVQLHPDRGGRHPDAPSHDPPVHRPAEAFRRRDLSRGPWGCLGRVALRQGSTGKKGLRTPLLRSCLRPAH